MAGHNKWSKVKHIKGAADAKRGRLFTKIIKEIITAARMGGGDPDGNPRLRAAINLGKSNSLPKDNIERAIKKGTGELEGESYDEIVYEGYGPGGVAILVESMTDNRNRTVSDLKNVFKKNGGNLGEAGSVAWMFDRHGSLQFENTTEDKVMEVAVEAGAEDVSESDGLVEVLTAPEDLYKVREPFEKLGMEPKETGFTYVPKNNLDINDKETAEKLLKLLDALEDHDDVQRVHSNFEMDDKLLAELAKE